MTIVGNNWLFDELGLSNDRAIVCPTSVWLESVECKVHDNHEPVRLGWIGVRSNLYHLDLLADAFATLAERLPGQVEIVIVSSEPVQTPLSTRFIPWSLETESASVLSFDIGLMPLQNDPFSRGKCAFKAIMCMSHGVPVIASPVGANADLIEHGRNGWLASSTDEWVAGVRALVDDVARRAEMGRQARVSIERGYASETAVRTIRDVIQRASGQRPRADETPLTGSVWGQR